MKYHFDKVHELKPGRWMIPFTSEPDKDPGLAGAEPINGNFYFSYDEAEDCFKVICGGMGEVVGLQLCLFWRALKAHAKTIGLGFLDLADLEGFEAQSVYCLFYLFKEAGYKGFSADRIRELQRSYETHATEPDCPAEAACMWLCGLY